MLIMMRMSNETEAKCDEGGWMREEVSKHVMVWRRQRMRMEQGVRRAMKVEGRIQILLWRRRGEERRS